MAILPTLSAGARAPGRRIPLVATVSLAVFVGACSGKNGAPPPTAALQAEELPVALVEQLSALPTVSLTLDEVVLPNGFTVAAFRELFALDSPPPAGPQDAKNLLVSELCVQAARLTDRSVWVVPAGVPNQVPQPNGLAYVFNGKRTDQPTVPLGGCCPALIGLDCSGFVAQVFGGAGVTLQGGPASEQRRPEVLTNALRANPAYTKLFAEDLGPSALGSVESGDVIYWNDANGVTMHIGIVLAKGDGSLAIYQSNGSSGKNRDGTCSEAECAKNAGPNRGPRSFPLAQANTFFRASGYTVGGVIRILAELSGDWNFRLRCLGASFDVVNTPIQFPVTTNSMFQVVQDFADYNGAPLSGTFDFSYDKVENELSCEFAISSPFCAQNPFRVERFTVRLDRDDTGYVGTTEILRTYCAGCLAEVRLINQEVAGAPDSTAAMFGILQGLEPNARIGPQ